MKKWTKPTLQKHGKMEDLTLRTSNNKDFGSDDGLTFQGQPVDYTS